MLDHRDWSAVSANAVISFALTRDPIPLPHRLRLLCAAKRVERVGGERYDSSHGFSFERCSGPREALDLCLALADVFIHHAHHLAPQRTPDLLVLHERVDQAVVGFNAANEIEVGLVVERVLELLLRVNKCLLA